MQNANNVNGQTKRDHLFNLSTLAGENTAAKKNDRGSLKLFAEQLKRFFYFSQKEQITNG